MTKAQFQLQSQPRGKGKPKNNWIAKWKKSLRRTINDYESTDSLINIHSFIHYYKSYINERYKNITS